MNAVVLNSHHQRFLKKKKKYHSFHKNIKQLLSNCFLGSKSAF